MTTRRNLLMGAAALPAAAILPAAATTEPELELVAGTALAPVEKYPWRWWVSLDGGEVYNEECLTKEEAIEIAKDYAEWEGRNPIIAECKQGDFYLGIDGGRILEDLADTNHDRMGEDGEFIEATRQQEHDLSRMLTATMYAWARKHGIRTTAWVFDGVRNEEVIEAAVPSHSLPSQESDQ